MSKKGDCYDNFAMESWKYSFGVEVIAGGKFLIRAEAMRDVCVYYNRKKLQSKSGNLSPEVFEIKIVFL